MLIYIAVAMCAGIGFGTIIGARFHEYIIDEEDIYVIEED